MFPYIIDLSNMDSAKRNEVSSNMARIAVDGPTFKYGTSIAYMVIKEKLPLSDLAAFLAVDESRITDAEGYDMLLWLRQ